MKDNTIKAIKGISIAVIILTVIVTFLEIWFWFQNLGNVRWTPDHSGWQWTVLISQLVFLCMLVATVMTFIVKTLKGLRNGSIFVRSNSHVIFTTAVVFFIYSLFDSTSHSAFKGEYVWSLNTEMLIYPLLIVIVSLLYRLAVEASEENDLTI